MQLNDWFQKSGVSRSAFAVKVGCSPARITQLCSGEAPRPALAHRIVDATNGEVTLADLYPPQASRSAAAPEVAA